ncbi:hypothetical protein [Kitasatospora sp. A2-31]|uniref:hypothetical protein n=1 Tax=Kitasatospora sp. A2-31 TaxID=2916414 RepID=UPI001EE9DDDD|nr:hypothetical protein [Kitasatospora sp. A2-31]MCG6494139.1 hypothetical protein [Kitasatospora sp. A2-31]
MSREGLQRLTSLLSERIGAPRGHGENSGRVEPLRRQVRHAVTGIDAYLSAVEAGSCTAAGLRERALDLWEGLERIASAWAEHDTPVPEGGARVPAQRAPLVEIGGISLGEVEDRADG